MADADVPLDEEFRSHGFLAPNINLIEEQIRSEFSDVIELLRDINTLLTKLVGLAASNTEGKSTLDPKIIAVVSGLRTLGNLQGAIILFEKGMASEAKILIRCMYENAFCMGALVESPEKFIEMFSSDNRASKHGIAKSLDKFQLSDEQSERLTQAINSVEKGRYLNIKDVADSSALKEAYLFYKHLSDDSMHHSATALSKHLVTDGANWSGFIYGPAEREELSETAFYCANSSFSFTVAFAQMLDASDFQEEINNMWKRVKVITPA